MVESTEVHMMIAARATILSLMIAFMAGAWVNEGLRLHVNPSAVVHTGLYEWGNEPFFVMEVLLSEACAEEFGDFTAAHVNGLLELFITESLSIRAKIMAPIYSGVLQFARMASEEEARQLHSELELAVQGAPPGSCFLSVPQPK
jgi:hypothetical protein